MVKNENHVTARRSSHTNPLNVHFSDHDAKHNIYIKYLTFGLNDMHTHIRPQNPK